MSMFLAYDENDPDDADAFVNELVTLDLPVFTVVDDQGVVRQRGCTWQEAYVASALCAGTIGIEEQLALPYG